MSVLQKILSNIPTSILGLIIIIVPVVLSVFGLLIIRRYISHERLRLHNDVAGIMFATLGAIYAVLIAFVVVTVWQNYEEVRSNVEKEADYLADLYWNSEAFPEPSRQKIRSLLTEYAGAVVNEEWELLSKGESSPKARGSIDKIWLFYSAYLPKTITEQVFFEESIKKLDEFSELGRIRLLKSHTGINNLLWFVLVFGGFITIIFTFFLGAENIRAQIVMTTLLSIIISLIIYTILEFDFPFTGRVSISPEPFRQFMAFSGKP